MNKKQQSSVEIAGFCRNLFLLYRSGISLGDGLQFMSEEEQNTLTEEMGRKIDEGALLSEVVKECGQFPEYVSTMMRIGEQTGRLEEALEAIADYYDGQEKMRKQVKNALAYPLILFGIMLLIIGVLLIRILPVFDEVYASLGSGLTGLAGGLLKAGQVLEAMLPALGILMAVLLAVTAVFWLNEGFREKARRFLQKKWGDCGMFRKWNEAHFAQALSMCMRSGMAAEEAVEIAGSLLQEIPQAEKRCRECLIKIAEGESLSAALRQTELLSVSDCRRLELGLRSGSGDEVICEIAERLLNGAEESLENAVSRIEPAMVMVTSLLVGIILLAVMLPLLDIMTALG